MPLRTPALRADRDQLTTWTSTCSTSPRTREATTWPDPATATTSTRSWRPTGPTGGPRSCARSTRAISCSPARTATSGAVSAFCAFEVNRRGLLGPVAVRLELMGQGRGKGVLVGALHELRRRGADRVSVVWVGPVLPYAAVGGRVGDVYFVYRKELGVNLLPVPRTLELTDELVDRPGRRVRGSTHRFPPQGYELRIGRDGRRAGRGRRRGPLLRRGHPRPAGAPARRSAARRARLRDHPDLPVRGVMLDISRDKVPTMDSLQAVIDRLASLKVNQVQLYSEHTFAYRGPSRGPRRRQPARRRRDHGSSMRSAAPGTSSSCQPELSRPHEPLALARSLPPAGHRAGRLRRPVRHRAASR